jgi:hypothetical protein
MTGRLTSGFDTFEFQGAGHVVRSRIVLGYIFLVGFPVLLMLGTLHLGKSLTAPLSVGGLWSLTMEPGAHLSGCDELLPKGSELTAELSQSGTTVAVTLNNGQRTVVNSTLASSRLTGASAPLRLTGCQSKALAMEADVVSASGGRALAGRFALAGCPSCGSIPFRASLRGRVTGKE